MIYSCDTGEDDCNKDVQCRWLHIYRRTHRQRRMCAKY